MTELMIGDAWLKVVVCVASDVECQRVGDESVAASGQAAAQWFAFFPRKAVVLGVVDVFK
jgi:hypothetical protein